MAVICKDKTRHDRSFLPVVDRTGTWLRAKTGIFLGNSHPRVSIPAQDGACRSELMVFMFLAQQELASVGSLALPTEGRLPHAVLRIGNNCYCST